MNGTLPTKERIKIKVAGAQPTVAKAVVVETKVGNVGTFDKIKYYYKFAIALVGSVVVFLNQFTGLFSFLPGDYKSYFTVIVTFVTALGVFLKENEKWVDKLPS